MQDLLSEVRQNFFAVPPDSIVYFFVCVLYDDSHQNIHTWIFFDYGDAALNGNFRLQYY